MKILFFVSNLILSIAIQGTAHADEPSLKCAKKAEQAVDRFVEKDYYDKDGFETYDCIVAKNNKAMICEVIAAKGDGAASDTYRVVLNLDCSRTYRVELIGEE